MFGKPTCPIDADSKQWIEKRFGWLADEFGLERLVNSPTVLPTEEFLPLDYDYSEEGIENLMFRCADLMGIDGSRLRLNFYEEVRPQYPDTTINTTAGLYSEREDGFDIWLEVRSLSEAAGTLAIIAHELGHVILLGQQRISPDEPDHEPLTDLLTVFLGIGIFPANSVISETNFGGWGGGWSMGKRGYLSMNMFGYAMALYTLARNEPKPTWVKFLRPDVKAAFKKGVKYIAKTKDCSFSPALDNVQ